MRKKKGKSKVGKFALFFMMLFFSVVGFTVVNQMEQYHSLEAEIGKLEEQVNKERERGIELKKQKEYYASDAYIEKAAREQLGFVKPNERVYVNHTE